MSTEPEGLERTRAQREKVDSAMRLRSRPWLTYVLAGLITIVWVTMCLTIDPSLFYSGEITKDQAISWGAFNTELVLQGQVWRVFTSSLIHQSYFHFLSNALGLFFLLPIAERYYGWKKMFGVAFISMIAASAGTSLAFGNVTTLGISDVIMATAGMLAAYQIYFYHVLPQRRIPFWLVFMIVIVLSGFQDRLTGGDTIGHMTGCLVGLGLGWLFLSRVHV